MLVWSGSKARSRTREKTAADQIRSVSFSAVSETAAKPQQRVILVLGMDRSGTSVCTNVLKTLGAVLGNDLVPGDRFNEGGYFEEQEIWGLHERILALLGRSWDTLAMVRPFPKLWWKSELMDGPRKQLADLARARVASAGSGVWAFKDPRTLSLLPLWKEVFEDLGIRPVHIVCVRHPGAVAQSLSERNGFPSLFSEMLWLEKTLGACLASVEAPNCLIHYEDWFTRPSRCIGSLLDATGLAPLLSAEETEKAVASIVSREMRHDFTLSPIESRAVSILYGELLKHTRVPARDVLRRFDEALEMACDFLLSVQDAIGERLNAAICAPPYERCTKEDLDRIRQAAAIPTDGARLHDPRLIRMQSMLRERERQLFKQAEIVASARQALTERDSLLVQAQERAHEREERLRAEERAHREKELRVAMQKSLDDRDHALNELRQELTGRDVLLSQAQERAHEREEKLRIAMQKSLDDCDHALNELRREFVRLRSSVSWRLTAPLRWFGTLGSKARSSVLQLLYCTIAFRYVGKPLVKLISTVGFPGSQLLLPENPLFEDSYYREQNHDAAARSKNLWAHYLGFGADEGRNPQPLFSTTQYLEFYRDVKASGMNPLMHYLKFGAAENRQPCDFDSAYYLKCYPDVRESGINPLLHYWRYGRHEGRQPVPSAFADTPRREAESTHFSDLSRPNLESSSPRISVILPVYNTPARYLRAAVESVLKQTWSHWQLCIYDDGSTRRETIDLLKYYQNFDERVSVRFGDRNRGISAASNAAMESAGGEYVAMLDHDDELTLDALEEVAKAINADPSIDVIYTDQAYIDANGIVTQTFFKPDWSPEFFRGVMFVGHLLVVRLALARQAGGFNPEFDRAQDFEFMLRLSEATSRISHIPKILYYWRQIPGSIAFHGNEKGAIEPIQAKAVNGNLQRLGIPAIASPHPLLAHRLVIDPLPRTAFPQVTVFVRDVGSASAEGCVRSLIEKSTYPNFTVALPASQAVRCGVRDRRINALDSSVTESDAVDTEFLIWIDGDLVVTTPDWIERLIFYCLRQDAGCAAPLILQESGAVWHSGLVLGFDESAGDPMRAWPGDGDGYAGSLSCAREVSAVSGESLMISSALFRDAGGWNRFFSTSLFSGADLSLRAGMMGRRNIVTPRAVLTKTGAAAQDGDLHLDRALFADRWREAITAGDPFYNRNFDRTSPGYAAAAAAAMAAKVGL